MAPVGGVVLGSWWLSSASGSSVLGVFSLLLLIIISIVFTSLCSNCARRSFNMREPEVEKTPSALIKVAKLDEFTASARENPMIDDIRHDELENGVPMQSSEDESGSWFTPWRSHLGTQKQAESDAQGADGQGTTSDTPANQLLARLRESASSTDAWVNRKDTSAALSAVSAPERLPVEQAAGP